MAVVWQAGDVLLSIQPRPWGPPACTRALAEGALAPQTGVACGCLRCCCLTCCWPQCCCAAKLAAGREGLAQEVHACHVCHAPPSMTPHLIALETPVFIHRNLRV